MLSLVGLVAMGSSSYFLATPYLGVLWAMVDRISVLRILVLTVTMDNNTIKARI